MRLGHYDPWVDYTYHLNRPGVKSNITMFAKVCDRKSRRDSWLENRRVIILTVFAILNNDIMYIADSPKKYPFYLFFVFVLFLFVCFFFLHKHHIHLWIKVPPPPHHNNNLKTDLNYFKCQMFLFTIKLNWWITDLKHKNKLDDLSVWE